LALTVLVVPLPVTLVTLAPLTPVPLRLKFEADTPVILPLKVTVQASDDAPEGFVPARLIDTTLGAIV
jgi:hypothetical protein